MKIWIHLNGVQEGPFNIEELPLHRMDPNTPVWYEGLSDWEMAKNAPLTAHLFESKQSQPAGISANADAPTRPGNAMGWGFTSGFDSLLSNAQRTGDSVHAQEPQKCPQTFILWSALMTVLCCNPFALIPLLFGVLIKSKFSQGDYEGAKKMSEVNEWLFIIAFVISTMMLPLSILFF